MRKYIALLLTVLMLVLAVPVTQAEGEDIIINSRPSTDIIIDSYSTSPTTIYNAQSFDLVVTLRKNTQDPISDLYITINPSNSFVPNNTGSKIQITDPWVDNKITKTIKLKYTGGSSTSLPLTITAKINNEPFSNEDYVNINAIPPQDPSQIPDVDTSKYAPILSVLNTTMPKANIGQTFRLPLNIVNTSAHYAKDVTIVPVYEGQGANPFQFTTINPSVFIDYIEGSKAKEVVFNFNVAPGTPSGVYTMGLKYKFSNLYGDSYETTESIYIKVESGNSAPKVSISRVNYPDNGLPAGGSSQVKLFLKNNGTFKAKDVKVTLKGLETGGFTVEGNGYTSSVATINSGQEVQVPFNITAAASMTSGSYDLTALIEYKDDTGNSFSEEALFFLPVSTGDPQSSELQIKNIEVSSKTYQIDENMPVRFSLVNTGQTKLYNVKISLTADQMIIPKTAAIKNINVMNPGQTEAQEFIFSATKEATTRNYPIAIQVDYEVEQGGKRVPQSLVQYVGVFVENKEAASEGSKSVPKIIIDSYSTDPTIVRAGSNFNLKISFHNTNSEKNVKNIKISFTAPAETESGSVFTPVNSSNTFYIDSISPKNSVEMDRVFFTIPDAKPKTYTIVANFEYEYDGLDGVPVTAQEQIGIPVVQQSRLETSTINMPPTSFMGNPIPLSFEFYNMGKVTLNNLMITVDGDFTNQNSNYFVGNFEPGYSDYYDTMIFPNAIGTLTGAIVFSYDDAAGEHQEIRKEFSTTVEEMQDVFNPEFPGGPGGEFPPDQGFPGEPQPTGIMKYVKNPIVWGVAAIIILGIAALIIVKKIKKRKELTLDE